MDENIADRRAALDILYGDDIDEHALMTMTTEQ